MCSFPEVGFLHKSSNGAMIEAISNHGLDNLTIQLTATGIAYLLS